MIENLAEEKVLGIVIENKLNLSLDLKYLNKICKKDKQKLGAFDNISKLPTLTSREKVANSSINFQFS